MTRPRLFTLFARARGGPFTIRSATYPAWPWIYRVVALSVPQAYALAAREIFRTGGGVGVSEIERYGDYAPIRAAEER